MGDYDLTGNEACDRNGLRFKFNCSALHVELTVQ